MIRSIVLPSMLALLVVTLGACVIEDHGTVTPPPQNVTCNAFSTFNQNCTPNCDASGWCESNYSRLDAEDQITLDDCSDCLYANLANGVCADCHDAYVGSCQAFLEDLLGLDCW